MRFNKAECKALYFDWGNTRYEYRGVEQTESSPARKDLGILLDDKLHMSHQCAQEGKLYSGLHQQRDGSREKKVIALLCSALVRIHLEYCMHVWGLQLWKDVGLFERVWRRATRIVRVLKHLSYRGKLRQLGLLSLEKSLVRTQRYSIFKRIL